MDRVTVEYRQEPGSEMLSSYSRGSGVGKSYRLNVLDDSTTQGRERSDTANRAERRRREAMQRRRTP